MVSSLAPAQLQRAAAPPAEGAVAAVQGSVVEVRFSPDNLPAINEALEVAWDEGALTLEVQSHVDDRLVRAVAMNKTSGLARGVGVRRTGAPIAVPVGKAVLGRVV